MLELKRIVHTEPPLPLDADPSTGHVTCDACWEANPSPHPPVDRMTDMRKNITFPKTSFAGGQNVG